MTTSDEAAQLIREAFDAALSGDNVGAAERITRLGKESSPSRMFGVCAAIALPAAEALKRLTGREPDLAAGEAWYVLHLRPHLDRVRRGAAREPWHLFSERFITAVLNRDDDNEHALYIAARSVAGTHFVRCVWQLFADVAGLCALAHTQGWREGG